MLKTAPALNDDGISVKGCSYIYAPRGQAGEYAPLATNPYRGCGHQCAYCYVPRAIKIDRKEFDAGATIRPSYETGLLKDARKYQAAGVTEQVMLSFTTDPYPPQHHDLTRRAIRLSAKASARRCASVRPDSTMTGTSRTPASGAARIRP